MGHRSSPQKTGGACPEPWGHTQRGGPAAAAAPPAAAAHLRTRPRPRRQRRSPAPPMRRGGRGPREEEVCHGPRGEGVPTHTPPAPARPPRIAVQWAAYAPPPPPCVLFPRLRPLRPQPRGHCTEAAWPQAHAGAAVRRGTAAGIYRARAPAVLRPPVGLEGAHGEGCIGLAATTWVPMGAPVPILSPNDHPDPSKGWQKAFRRSRLGCDARPCPALPCHMHQQLISDKLLTGRSALALP